MKKYLNCTKHNRNQLFSLLMNSYYVSRNHCFNLFYEGYKTPLNSRVKIYQNIADNILIKAGRYWRINHISLNIELLDSTIDIKVNKITMHNSYDCIDTCLNDFNCKISNSLIDFISDNDRNTLRLVENFEERRR